MPTTVNDAIKDADSLDGLANKVATFLAFCKERAAGGLTVAEFGELLLAFLRVCISAADTFPMEGSERKTWVLHAVGVLFDEIADALVPVYLRPFWPLCRSCARSLVLKLASGAIEALLPLIRGDK